MPQLVFPAPGTENSLQFSSQFGGIDLGSSAAARIPNLLNYTEDLNNAQWEKGTDLIAPKSAQFNTVDSYLNDLDLLRPTVFSIVKLNSNFRFDKFQIYNSADQYVFDKDLLLLDNLYRPVRNEIDVFQITTTDRLSYLRQNIILEKNQYYTLSFYVKRGTATNLQLAVYADSAYPLLAPFSYYHLTNELFFSRISATFFYPDTVYNNPLNNTVTVYLLYPFTPPGQAGTVFLHKPQLERGQAATNYEPSVGFSLASQGAISKSNSRDLVLGAITPYPFSSNTLVAPALPITGYDYVSFDSARQYVFDTDLLPTTTPPAIQANVVTNRTFYFPYQPVAPFTANTFVRFTYASGNIGKDTVYYVNSTTNYSINIAASVLPYIGGTITDAASFTYNQNKINEINSRLNQKNLGGDAISNYYIANYYKPNFKGLKFNLDPVDQKNNLFIIPPANENQLFNINILETLSSKYKLRLPLAEDNNKRTDGIISRWYSSAYNLYIDLATYSKLTTDKFLLPIYPKDQVNIYGTSASGILKFTNIGLGALRADVENLYSLKSLGKILSVIGNRLADLTSVENRRKIVGRLAQNYFTLLKSVPDNRRVDQIRLGRLIRQSVDDRIRSNVTVTGNLTVSPINNFSLYQSTVQSIRSNRSTFTPVQRLVLTTDFWLAGSRQIVNFNRVDNDYAPLTNDTIERQLKLTNLLSSIYQTQEVRADPVRFDVGNFTRQIIVNGILNENFLYRLGRIENNTIFTPLVQNYIDQITNINFINKKLFVLQSAPDQRPAAKMIFRPTAKADGNEFFGVAKVLVRERLRTAGFADTAVTQLRKYVNEGAVGPVLRVVGQNNITYDVVRDFIFDNDFSGNTLIPLTANTNANANTVTVSVNSRMELISPAVYFDGYDDIVNSTSSIFGSLLDFHPVGTIEMFVQPVIDKQIQIIASFGDSGKNFGSDIANLNSTDIFLNKNLQVCIGKVGIAIGATSTIASAEIPETILVRTTTSLSSHKLSHLAVVFENYNIRIYIDGVQQNLIGGTQGYNFSPSQYRMAIGYSAGLISAFIPVELLLVGGGGSTGGYTNGGAGGGGGGGGVLVGTATLTRSTAYSVTIGSGGSATSAYPGSAGNNTVISLGSITYTAFGGGGGSNSASGGSGGGSFQGSTPTRNSPTQTTQSTFTGYGSGGGSGSSGGSGAGAGGGGGGAGGSGADGYATFPFGCAGFGGNGGPGFYSTITGANVAYGGGGGGGSEGLCGRGGVGGGGNGWSHCMGAGYGWSATQPGVANTGGGAGGSGGSGGTNGSGANGGSGVIVIATQENTGISVSGNLTYDQVYTRPGWNVYRLLGGTGTFQFGTSPLGGNPARAIGLSSSDPALSPQQLMNLGYSTNGFYWYRASEMSSTVQLYTQFNLADNRAWVRVFSAPFAATATVNQVGQTIPWHGILLQESNGNNRQFTYFATRQLFNTRSDTATSTSGSISGVRVFIGQAGGHGFYNTAQLPCNWGSSQNGLIASGYDGSCGSFPDAMRWGIANGSVNYSMLGSATVETWVYWTHIGS